VKPPLPSFCCRARIPAERKTLYAAVRKLNQILLKRIDAKDVFNLKLIRHSVSTLSEHEEFPFSLAENRNNVMMVEAGILKVTEDC
jgi:hypothetical protein